MSKCQTVQDEKKIESITVKTRDGAAVPMLKLGDEQESMAQQSK